MLLTNYSRQPTLILVALLLAASMTLTLLATLIHHQPVQAAPAATYVSGPILTHTTWSLAGSPYIMTDSVTVNPGITLTVEPGVTVMGQQSDVGLYVQGHLQAIGTVPNPITFTSELDSGPGEWAELAVAATGSGHLNQVTIQYATTGVGVFSELSLRPFIIENSFIQDNSGYAIETDENSVHNLHMSNVTFNNNGNDRVHVDVFSATGSSTLTSDTFLTAQTGLEGYEVSGGGLNVPLGMTLTLAPGVVLMMSEDSWLSINGYLEARGMVTKPITFTSALNSGPGQWEGMGIGVRGYAHLNYVVVRYSDYGFGVNNHLSNNLITLTNSIIHDNSMYAMSSNIHTVSNLVISNVVFSNNGYDRIRIDASWPEREFAKNTTLTAQPGLEGYEFYEDGAPRSA